MIHAYLTDGFFEMGKVFLESLWQTNRDTYRCLLTTRNFNDQMISEYRNIYPGLQVENKLINFEKMSDYAKVPVKTLKKWKKEIESRYVTPQNRCWKLMIAGDDRPHAIYDLMLRGEGKYIPILHFDIDTLFRRNLWPMSVDAAKHDLCLLLRPKINPVKARITISTIGIKTNERTIKFFSRWMHWIGVVPPLERPIGYGQTSCWKAFEECPDLIVKTLDRRFAYPGQNRKDNIIWTGAIHKMTKEDCVKYFRREMRSA